MQRILVATDGSEDADRAVAMAAELVRQLNASLLILSVSERDSSSAQIRALERNHISEGDALDELVQRILEKASARARSCGVTNVRTLASAGDPAEKILHVAQREQIEAIVVGRRGRGRLVGLLLGSVSQKMATLAPCAVIIVPGSPAP